MTALVFALLTSLSTFAYIPEYSLIASRTADQHGRGAFLIENEVILRRDGEPLTVKETWTVNGEGQMRVTLEGKGPLKGLVQGSILFENTQKFFIDPSTQRLMQQRLGEDWLEPLFHFRSSKFLRSRLVTLKVAPAESLHDRAPLSSDNNDPQYTPPGFVRLSRVGGSVAWAIGTPPANGVATAPTLWIEQDQFVIRKLRTPDQTVVKADDYTKYDDGLYFPRTRTYNFGKTTVEIRTVSVKSLGRLKGVDSRFKNSSLVAARDALKLPDAEALKEFYARYR